MEMVGVLTRPPPFSTIVTSSNHPDQEAITPVQTSSRGNGREAAIRRKRTLRPANTNFRFEFWPWQFPGRIGSPAASSGLIAAENGRFSLFWEIPEPLGPGLGALIGRAPLGCKSPYSRSWQGDGLF